MKHESNDGGPAFPIPIAGCNDGGVYNALEQSAGTLGGMSLRDYFAAAALTGLQAHKELGHHPARMLAMLAWSTADAMLDARKESSR